MNVSITKEYAVFMSNGQIDMVFPEGKNSHFGTALEQARESADFEDGDYIRVRTVFEARAESDWEEVK